MAADSRTKMQTQGVPVERSCAVADAGRTQSKQEKVRSSQPGPVAGFYKVVTDSECGIAGAELTSGRDAQSALHSGIII